MEVEESNGTIGFSMSRPVHCHVNQTTRVVASYRSWEKNRSVMRRLRRSESHRLAAASREWRTAGSPTTDELLRVQLDVTNMLTQDLVRLYECVPGVRKHKAAN